MIRTAKWSGSNGNRLGRQKKRACWAAFGVHACMAFGSLDLKGTAYTRHVLALASVNPAFGSSGRHGAKHGLDTMLPHANNRYTRVALDQLAAHAADEEAKRIVAEHGELGLRVSCRRKRPDLIAFGCHKNLAS